MNKAVRMHKLVLVSGPLVWRVWYRDYADMLLRLLEHVWKIFQSLSFTHDMLCSENLKAVPCIVDMWVTKFSEL